jgi:hypothetical protein
MPDHVSRVLSRTAAAVALMGAWQAAGLARGPQATPAQPAGQGASRFALAIVSDQRGKAVVDIGADDFVVQEGGATREVLDVRVADYPLVLVIDNGTAADADFAAIKSAATRFLERMGPRPMAIVTTAGTPRIVATFEDDRTTLLQRLESVEHSAAEASQPVHAAAIAGRTIQATGTLFSSIVIITSTPAEISGPAADELLAPIIDSRAVVHVVADDRVVAPTGQFLRALAQQTHGGFTAIYAAPSYTPALERLVTRLTTELMVEYIVPVGSKASDPKIGVRIPGARVRGLGVAPR